MSAAFPARDFGVRSSARRFAGLRRALQNLPHLRVRELRELLVRQADRQEGLRAGDAHHLVCLPAERFAGGDRRRGGGDTIRAGPATAAPRRRRGRWSRWRSRRPPGSPSGPGRPQAAGRRGRHARAAPAPRAPRRSPGRWSGGESAAGGSARGSARAPRRPPPPPSPPPRGPAPPACGRPSRPAGRGSHAPPRRPRGRRRAGAPGRARLCAPRTGQDGPPAAGPRRRGLEDRRSPHCPPPVPGSRCGSRGGHPARGRARPAFRRGARGPSAGLDLDRLPRGALFVFGSVTLRMPSLNSAFTFASSTVEGSLKERRKLPKLRSKMRISFSCRSVSSLFSPRMVRTLSARSTCTSSLASRAARP